MRSERAGAGEYAPYYERYVDLVPDGDIVESLAVQWLETRALLAGVEAERETFRYAEGKWSLRESVGHVVDTERVFMHRILWFARGVDVAMPGMDQDAWVPESGADDRPLADHLAEWQAVRGSLVALLQGLPPENWGRGGIASDVPVSVRGLAWITAGHELHHRSLWRDAYGVSSP